MGLLASEKNYADRENSELRAIYTFKVYVII